MFESKHHSAPSSARSPTSTGCFAYCKGTRRRPHCCIATALPLLPVTSPRRDARVNKRRVAVGINHQHSAPKSEATRDVRLFFFLLLLNDFNECDQFVRGREPTPWKGMEIGFTSSIPSASLSLILSWLPVANDRMNPVSGLYPAPLRCGSLKSGWIRELSPCELLDWGRLRINRTNKMEINIFG